MKQVSCIPCRKYKAEGHTQTTPTSYTRRTRLRFLHAHGGVSTRRRFLRTCLRSAPAAGRQWP